MKWITCVRGENEKLFWNGELGICYNKCESDNKWEQYLCEIGIGLKVQINNRKMLFADLVYDFFSITTRQKLDKIENFSVAHYSSISFKILLLQQLLQLCDIRIE